jgi:L-alanine-DL-glutamate epimerase-like enolase superfamily enzyme
LIESIADALRCALPDAPLPWSARYTPRFQRRGLPMKIARVEAVQLSIPFTYGGNRRLAGSDWRKLDFCLVRVETDSGAVGWGDAFAYGCRRAVATAVNDMVAPLAVGHDAADIAGLHAKLQRDLHLFGRYGITVFAISALDIALWDLAGKVAGKPLHALLGGAKRKRIPCYASLLRYAEPKLVAEYCRRALDEGYDAIKLHEVTDDPIAAARAVVPRGAPLMVDTNCEWTPEGAIEAAQRFRAFDLEWLEEPVFPPEDFRALRATGEASGVPIAAGENFCFATQFAASFEARAVTFAQPSVTKVGGITEFLKVVALADAQGVRVAPHSPYFGPGGLATLHLLAVREDARFECFYLWPEGRLFGAALDPVGGALNVPAGPGLGVDPDPEVMRQFRVD